MNGRLENQIKIEMKIKKKLEYYPQILTDYYYSLGSKAATTKRTYMNYLMSFCDYAKGRYPNFSNKDLKEMDSAYLQEYLSTKEYIEKEGELVKTSVDYRGTLIAALRSFFDFLRKKKIIDENPALDLEKPRAKKENKVTYLTPEEIAIVYKRISEGYGSKYNFDEYGDYVWRDRDIALVYLALHSGLRVSAISQINMEDIDFKNHTIHVIEKENYSRDINIGGETEELIKVWIDDRRSKFGSADISPLFLSVKGKRLSIDYIEDMIKKYCSGFDKKITPHKLRATYGTTVYNMTQDIYLTADLLGHSNINTTRRYAEVSKKRKEDVRDNLYKIY